MKEEYSVGRMTRRWPMRLFFSMMNIAGINSQIIYKANTEHLMLRRQYLKEIAMGPSQAIYDQKSYYCDIKCFFEEPNCSLCTYRRSIIFKEGGLMQYLSNKEK